MRYKITRVNQFSANDWQYLGSTSSEFGKPFDDIVLYHCFFFLVKLHGEYFLHVKEHRDNITLDSVVISHWRIYVSEWLCIDDLVHDLIYQHKQGVSVSAQKVIRIFKDLEKRYTYVPESEISTYQK